jgi:hypothetical protein
LISEFPSEFSNFEAIWGDWGYQNDAKKRCFDDVDVTWKKLIKLTQNVVVLKFCLPDKK